MAQSDVLIFGSFGLLVCAAVLPSLLRLRKKPKAHPLDVPLFHWNKTDVLTLRGLLDGGVHAWGRTGSGKTSSLKALAKAIVGYGNSSILVLCGKRNEYKDWLEMARAARREADVILIDSQQPHRLNMVGYQASRKGEGAGQATNVTRYILELRSVIFRESEQLGGESQQWKTYSETQIEHAVTMLLLADEPITAANIYRLLLSAPVTEAQKANPKWEADYCNQCIGKAFARAKSPMESEDFELGADYFLKIWPSLSDRTQSSISVGTMATLNAMNKGWARELFGSTTNTTPLEQIEGRKIVIVNLPPDEWGNTGLVGNVGLKSLWQNEILRREATDDSPVACIWGDESSMWFTPTDARYLSRCRSAKGCMVYICQSLNSYKEAMPSEKAEAAIEAMLAQFSHRLVFALGDYSTATWAADHVGKALQQLGGGSVQHSDDLVRFNPESHSTSNFSESYQHIVQPGEFMHGFRTGSPVNGFLVDAILLRSGMPFSNGLPFIAVTFDQRK